MSTSSGPSRRDLAVLDLGVPALLRVAQMLVQIGLVAWFDHGTDRSLWSHFSIWDGQQYADIVRHGYPHHIAVGTDGKLVAGHQFGFSPLFPGLSWLVHTVTRLGVEPSQLVVSWAASIALGILVHLIVRALGHGRRAGYVATWLIGALPMSVVLQMGYAEALCAALGAGAMYAGLRGRWWTAAVLGLLAGLTRPTGAVAGIAAGCLGIIRIARRRGETRSEWLPVALTTLSGVIGMVAWIDAVWLRAGRHGTWFQVQKDGWGTRLDFGRQAFTFLHDTLRSPDATGWTPVVVTAILLLAMVVVLTVILDGREWVPFALLGVLTLAAALGSTNYWQSRARLLLTGALLVVPLGTFLGRAPLRLVAPLLLLAFLASAWFGTWMIDGWPYAI